MGREEELCFPPKFTLRLWPRGGLAHRSQLGCGAEGKCDSRVTALLAAPGRQWLRVPLDSLWAQ
ncbi:hypothetical protein San01_54650 [Streptomyces angustmyceticus]|uniref:Uncharacterized protein n=1 Tax=Streptomyces angustmyceticus TaxID=285578 RepID=A0A5J4LFR0_9ACTN|nr:hypothetical protein San01_54650 [Streptomyces angustmyceticus]